MGKQSTIWMQSEANAWHKRNHLKPHENDPVMLAIKNADIVPTKVFEIGCGNGWRLSEIQKKYKCEVGGCDLSNEALTEAQELYLFSNTQLGWREARNLKGIQKEGFDLVIYGFCLYQCDPEDLFAIVKEGDRILADGGYLIIHDFWSDHTHSRKYAHSPDLLTYKMDFPRLWLAHPAYTCVLVSFNGDDPGARVTVLHKDMKSAFPLEI